MDEEGVVLTCSLDRGDYTIHLTEAPVDCGEFVDSLIRPLLLAMGYLPVTVADYIPDGQTAQEKRMEMALVKILDEASGENRRSAFAAAVRRLAGEGLTEG